LRTLLGFWPDGTSSWTSRSFAIRSALSRTCSVRSALTIRIAVSTRSRTIDSTSRPT